MQLLLPAVSVGSLQEFSISSRATRFSEAPEHRGASNRRHPRSEPEWCAHPSSRGITYFRPLNQSQGRRVADGCSANRFAVHHDLRWPRLRRVAHRGAHGSSASVRGISSTSHPGGCSFTRTPAWARCKCTTSLKRREPLIQSNLLPVYTYVRESPIVPPHGRRCRQQR